MLRPSYQRVPMRRRRSPWRAIGLAAAILVAALAVSVVATGIRYAMKTGVSVGTAVGLLLPVVGVVVLGLVARRLWRAGHGWQRLWFVPGTLAVLMLIAPVGLAVMFTQVPRSALGHVTPADRGISSYREVTLPATDGVRLAGWLVPSKTGAAVVLVPGAGSTRTGTLAQAAVLARHGYGLLMIDHRGQGRSGGDGMDMGWYGDRDIGGAVAFLARQPGVDPKRIGVLGMSMGGEEAIGAAAADSRIRAVVAEGATLRTAEDKAGWLPHSVAGAMQRALDRVTFQLVDWLSAVPKPIPLRDAVARASGTPYLLITAGTMADEGRAAENVRSAAPDRVTVWTVPGAAHTGGLQTRPAEWESRVVGFLDRVLARGS